MSRLADIYKSEKSSGGGLGSTLGKAALEKIDPRKMFNQKGLMAAMLPSLFKSYSATGSKINTASPQSTQGSESQLSSIATDSKINAKNSIVLPTMARDMNVMRQNIVKLVKLQGGKASTKADMFFKSSVQREAEYESKFKKESKSTPSGSGSAGGASGPGKSMKGIGLDFLSSVMGGAGAALGGVGKGIGIAAIGLGIGGFFAGLATGGAAVQALGGSKGVKDMLVDLAEGLGAFSGQSLLAFGALLGAGGLFGVVTGVSAPRGLRMMGGTMLGMTAIGLGLGGFLAGLALGGAGIAALGGSGGVKQMMVDLAEGLNAFNPSSMEAFASLLGAGGLFGVVTGIVAPVGFAMMGGTMLGMTAIGLGLAGFLASLALGGKGIDMLGGGRGVKDMLVNLAEGLNAFTGLDAGNLTELALAIPAFGVGMLGFFGMQGIAGIIKSFTEGIKGVMDWIFGNEKGGKTPMQQLASDLTLFQNINGDNLSKIGQGFKDLASGLLGFAKVTDEDLARAKKAVAAGVGLTKNVPTAPSTPSAPSTTSPSPVKNEQDRLRAAQQAPGSGSSTSPTKSNGSSNLLDIIAGGESGRMGYDAANKGKAGDMPGGYPGLSKMTVNDVMKLQSKGEVFATGRYQIIPKTLAGLMAGNYGNTGVKGTDLYDASTQDKLVTALINKRLQQGGDDPIKQQYALSQEFASIANPYTNSSYYDKVGNNKASIGTSTIQAALTGSPSATMLASNRSSSGETLASASNAVAEQRMAMASGSSGGAPIVNAPVTNNTVNNSGGRSGGIISAFNDDMMKYLLIRTA